MTKQLDPNVVNKMMELGVTDAKDPQWANEEQTIINLKLLAPKIHEDYIPFSAMASDIEPLGRFLFTEASRFTFGKIKSYEPYVETDEERRAKMPPLEKWRVNTILDIYELNEKIDAVIEELKKIDMALYYKTRNKKRDVVLFYRKDSLWEDIGSRIEGMTPEKIDEMWQEALDL